jgi:putative ABC transport system substrate-binding protein
VAVAALAQERSPIPIIFVNVSDPVGSGFVTSLAKPGGTITGFISQEPTLGGKWTELLKEIAPELRRVGLLFNPDTAPYADLFLRSAEAAAASFGVELKAARFRDDAGLEHTIAEFGSEPGGGLIVLPENTTNTRSEFIIRAAVRYRVPTIYAYRYQANAGGLISYGVKGGYDAGTKLVASVIIHPASTTHKQLTDAQKVQAGAGPDVVRLSIGIEDKQDIIADLDQALNAA